LAADEASACFEMRCAVDSDRLVIWRRNHLLGVWVWLDDGYAWIPAAYLLPSVSGKRLKEAAAFTWSLFSRRNASMSDAGLKA